MALISLDEGTIHRICELLAPMVADMIDSKNRRLLTSKEKARQLGISEGTLRQWVWKGKINAIKDGSSKQSRLLFEP